MNISTKFNLSLTNSFEINQTGIYLKAVLNSQYRRFALLHSLYAMTKVVNPYPVSFAVTNARF